ncbi:MAG TPA: 5,6-dimethylbenzimidazole synthase [Hyphomicrobiaceae bacterium]|nr:5,6-dimethylbenzimidazole synthase [Hyphomicrobiaceae bacterium]
MDPEDCHREANFLDGLDALFRSRRDVRRFRRDPVPSELAEAVIGAMGYAPSVGLSEPARLIEVATPEVRCAVQHNFERCNGDALNGYEGERASLYAGLKLEGLREAPLQIAVYADRATAQGHGLGRQTMPETLAYSVVAGVTLMWLAAEARGLGLGWVSILDPGEVNAVLGVPSTWQFIGYLCIGWPVERGLVPELEQAGWEQRRWTSQQVETR